MSNYDWYSINRIYLFRNSDAILGWATEQGGVQPFDNVTNAKQHRSPLNKETADQEQTAFIHSTLYWETAGMSAQLHNRRHL